jgi:hypothetical protein
MRVNTGESKRHISNYIWMRMKNYYESTAKLSNRKYPNGGPDQKEFKKYCVRSCHNYAVHVVCGLAQHYKCLPLTEFPAAYEKDTVSSRITSGRVDVVWFNRKGKLVAAFEVDRGYRKNSLLRLSGTSGAKFFICVGTAQESVKFYRSRRNSGEGITFVNVRRSAMKGGLLMP